MTEYSIGDVADRAGVANDYVVMLVELGILSSARTATSSRAMCGGSA
jgi:hypothetical protein